MVGSADRSFQVAEHGVHGLERRMLNRLAPRADDDALVAGDFASTPAARKQCMPSETMRASGASARLAQWLRFSFVNRSGARPHRAPTGQ